MIRRIRILGIPVLTIETDDEPTDLPTAHRHEDKR